ncbi:gluconate 2-dehydrogenase subunit 3 family protein [Hephaestia caeni]|uniref:gluconate 2-dehydrogenase subunit 3 family protein n=1 Tax=Hephaestia caeni TaxID=645617 RepID=UPI001474E68C|nr:gluconate 2-dehydrogenase subunit 3 family protein [Hephaestia caeni]
MNRLEGLDRRALIRRALLLVGGAALSLPRAVLAGEGAPYLAPERLDTLAAYADSLIPATDTAGAIDAGVPRTIDAMLRDWASDKTRADFAATLDALDDAARSATGKKLAVLSADRRAPVVAAFDADRIAALDSAYIRLRELTLIAYYLSEPGATQELRYELIPGVWEADIALGDDRRAWAV